MSDQKMKRLASYNPLLLADYRPNRTFLLTDNQRNELHDAARYDGEQVSSENYRRILNSLIFDLSHASSNFENVNISWFDTKALIEFGEKPKELNDLQLRVVLNHKAAIKFMVENSLELNRCDLFDLHNRLVEGLEGDGWIRTKNIEFDDSRYAPLEKPHQIEDEFDKLLDKASKITDPFEQSFFALTFIAYLQPFQDGNERTSRLAMNIPLLKEKLPPFSFANINKEEYTLGLLRSTSGGNHSLLANAFHRAYLKTVPRHKQLVALVQEGGILNTL